MAAEATLQERIAHGKKLVADGTAQNVGVLQGELKKKFGKGLPPSKLGLVFGTSKRRKKKASGPKRGPGRPRGSRNKTPRANRSGFAVPLDMMEVSNWMELVQFLNAATGGNPTFALRMDGINVQLTAE